jgi:CRP/FNR family cyclic AMP-dependent transcriptional regulator
MDLNDVVTDKRPLLAKHQFFQGMPPEFVERLASHARLTSEPAGRVLFRKGDPGAGLVAIVSGIVRISVASGDGNEIVLNLVGRDEILGEISLIDGGARTADAVTATKCQLLTLDRRDFVGVLRDHPDFAVRLLALVSARLRRTSEQLEDMTFADPETRLAKALLRLAEIQGAGEGAPVLITQKALGWMVGLSRESTNKCLRKWETAGYVMVGKGTCVIRQREILQRMTKSTGGETERAPPCG